MNKSIKEELNKITTRGRFLEFTDGEPKLIIKVFHNGNIDIWHYEDVKKETEQREKELLDVLKTYEFSKTLGGSVTDHILISFDELEKIFKQNNNSQLSEDLCDRRKDARRYSSERHSNLTSGNVEHPADNNQDNSEDKQ